MLPERNHSKGERRKREERLEKRETEGRPSEKKRHTA